MNLELSIRLRRSAMAKLFSSFVGRMSYCYSKCLAMIFQSKGDNQPLPFIECISTAPFGFVYEPEDGGGFAVNGYNPHVSVGRALKLLRYDNEFRSFSNCDEALRFLRRILEKDVALIGPLDMGFLTYDPYRKFKLGSDHYVVATEVIGEQIVVSDPDGYVHVPTPITDFLKAWRADRIRYKHGPYSLRTIGGRRGKVSKEDIYETTLRLGLRNLREKREVRRANRILYCTGFKAIERLAEDIRRKRSSRWLRFYSTFTFRVSAQKCFDSSLFIREAPFMNRDLSMASETRMTQARLYSDAQLHGAMSSFSQVSRTLLAISQLEDEFEKQLALGLAKV